MGREVSRCPVGCDRGTSDRDRLRRRHVDALTCGGGGWVAGPGPGGSGPAAQAAGLAARDSYGRLLALLSASTSDLASAEDALADAFERALRTWPDQGRSEEHTSELQSRPHLVCRLLLEKKKKE